jgi:hypothetical protein
MVIIVVADIEKNLADRADRRDQPQRPDFIEPEIAPRTDQTQDASSRDDEECQNPASRHHPPIADRQTGNG